VKNRLLQYFALYAPGMTTLRIHLHRCRGIRIGNNVSIGTDVILETEYPSCIWIGDRVAIGIRTVILAHNRDQNIPREKEITVKIENDVAIGPGSIILPNVTVGYGAVVAAGSVVSRHVPPLTMVQGNPARPIARCGIPLGKSSYKDFVRKLRPIR